MSDLKVRPPEEKSRSLGFARDDIYKRWGRRKAQDPGSYTEPGAPSAFLCHRKIVQS